MEVGKLADLHEDQHQRRDAHEPSQDERGATRDLAGRYGPERRAAHPRVRVALHPLIERGDGPGGQGGSQHEERDPGGVEHGSRRGVANERRRDRQEAQPRLRELQGIPEPRGRLAGAGHGAGALSIASRWASQVSQKAVASVTAPTSTWPVVVDAERRVRTIAAPARIAIGAARSRHTASANPRTAAASTQAIARWANWIPTRKLHSPGSSPPPGVDHGKVGIASPAKLWRTTAPTPSCANSRTQQATPARRTRLPTGSGRVIHAPEQEAAMAMSAHAMACARQACSIANSWPRLVSTTLTSTES